MYTPKYIKTVYVLTSSQKIDLPRILIISHNSKHTMSYIEENVLSKEIQLFVKIHILFV